MNLTEFLDALPRGGKKVIALRLGVTPSYLSRLVSGDRSITAERALQIEEVTGGAVSRQELRPDLQWLPPKRAKSLSKAAPPTMPVTIPATSHHRQSAAGAVNPSSNAQASP
ncbi:YdaS family helix-turn-helix protein [Pseudomonas monteilii]|uniref:transcriptional regulator n=1 Tax=Pseudomonas monteilii TaxID=76759 RepID=UPI00130E2B75